MRPISKKTIKIKKYLETMDKKSIYKINHKQIADDTRIPRHDIASCMRTIERQGYIIRGKHEIYITPKFSKERALKLKEIHSSKTLFQRIFAR